jgi:DNA-binding GntR family transcriptional regulator
VINGRAIDKRAKRINGQAPLRAWIETQIADGHLRPGARLDEKKLCERFHVSRTPVREALLQLASVGLVTFLPRQGAIVAKKSVKDIVAMWEVLTGLEGLAAEIAARRMTAEARARMVKLHKASSASVTSGDVASYDQANRQLHELIYDGTQNDYLAQHVKDIRRRLQVYRRLPFERPGGLDRSFQGHSKVVEAILAGDEKGANAAMKEHVSGGLTFLDFVAQLTDAASEHGDAPLPRSRTTKAFLRAGSRKAT